MRDDHLLRDILRGVLERHGRTAFRVEAREFWTFVRSDRPEPPTQGWKLHLSATMLSAPIVLSRAAEVLTAAGTLFKFTSRLTNLWDLLSPQAPRGSSGKFITVYPDNDDEARRLALDLDVATYGLPGPAILSDRQLRPGSLVHYRYGAFSGHRVLADEGIYDAWLADPAGDLLPDLRQPRFAPPAFAPSLFDEQPSTRVVTSVRLRDRYLVREAITITNRGGIYVAEDTETSQPVVIKEGRPHVASDLTGLDARTRISRERDALEILAPLGITPALIESFEQGGHLFVVEEMVAGTTLRDWIEHRAGPQGLDGFGTAPETTRTVLRRLVSLLTDVHSKNLVVRDLTPNNLMVLPDTSLRLVDLEHSTAPSQPTVIGGTAGYVSPEMLGQIGDVRQAPDLSLDLFGLGAVSCFVATGHDLVRVPVDGLGAPDWSGLAEEIRRMSMSTPALAAVLPMVLGLLAPPATRWNLQQCTDYLQSSRPAIAISRSPGQTNVASLAGGCLEEILAAFRKSSIDDRPWPVVDQPNETDPCAVWTGAAGQIAVLTAVQRYRPSSTLETVLHSAIDWLRRRLETEDRWPTGLYYGRSGSLLALYDAAKVLDDEKAKAFALDAGSRIPTSSGIPDITHGLAGAAVALLRLGLLDRAEATLESLLAGIVRSPAGPEWPTSSPSSPRLAGTSHYGFAHGIAGIGTALQYGGILLQRPDWLTVVDEIAGILISDAEVDGDTVWWPIDRHDRTSTRPRSPHWCSGSSGIGSFLVRFWRRTGDSAALDLAVKAATAAYRTRFISGNETCHGLPGNGDFLLDMAGLTGNIRFAEQATDIATVLARRAVHRGGRAVLLTAAGKIDTAYLNGLAGVLGFLTRLASDSSRLWMVDDLVDHPTAGAAINPDIRGR
ncbi:class IV lanthionine synthetase LanL [Kribbella sp. NPDC055071]